MVEGHVPARACWFDSSPGHFLFLRSLLTSIQQPGRLILIFASPLKTAFSGNWGGSPLFWAVFVCGLVAGCEENRQELELDGGQASYLTQSDRLRVYYPDLVEGRFAVIADFESPSHGELFKMLSAEPGDTIQETVGGVKETGEGCLKAVFRNFASELIADNDNAKRWLLKRDWRPYNLLLMNVFIPKGGGDGEESLDAGAEVLDDAPVYILKLGVVSGRGEFVAEAYSYAPLRRGWNLLRFDLGEIRDVVAMDDVRQIRCSLSADPGQGAVDWPVEVVLDDALLVDNRKELFGSREGTDGTLYVVEEGRSIYVGAARRFEIGFSNGQLVSWYDLSSDPVRLNNLAGRGVIGPSPIVVSDKYVADGELPLLLTQAKPPGEQVAVSRQTLIEATDVRVVVECQLGIGETGADRYPEGAYQRLAYTIYPSGNVFVSVECATELPLYKAERIGLAVGAATTEGIETGVHESGEAGERPILQHLCYGWLAPVSKGAGLLFVLHDSRTGPDLSLIHLGGGSSGDFGESYLVAYGGEVDYPIHRWHCLLNFWPVNNCERKTREDIAIAYCHRPRISFMVGEFERESEGDWDGDGFNEREGMFMLGTDSNRVQFKLDGRSRKVVSPVFCVPEAAGREAWVYINYAICRQVSRDGKDRLVFQLPGTYDDEVVVEVYLRNLQ